VTVCNTGGHGEWFVQAFPADGAAPGLLAALTPAEAAQRSISELVAGSQADALVALRGRGTAMQLLPDARHFALLTPGDLTIDTTPIYGRGPDARLPGAA
jgi:hypothetical protein